MQLGCPFTCLNDTTALAVEYYHAAFDRYFFTHNADEIAKLDTPGTSGGWVRTGQSWNVITSYGKNIPVEGVIHKTYRFWSPSAEGTPSHFFTVNQSECAQLRDGEKRNWTYEGSTFWAREPVNGTCSADADTPLYRIYNNSVGGAPSHRFAVQPSVVNEMVGKGWTSEGVAMCVAK